MQSLTPLVCLSKLGDYGLDPDLEGTRQQKLLTWGNNVVLFWQTHSHSSGDQLKIDYLLVFHCIFAIAICPFAENSTSLEFFTYKCL